MGAHGERIEAEAHVLSLMSPLGPLMSARSRALSLRSTGRSSPMRLKVEESSSGSALMISKYSRRQRAGASLEGCIESALHSMKKGRRPWRSSARLTVLQVSTWRTVNLRSEEHTSELQSRSDLVCRLLLEKKKK